MRWAGRMQMSGRGAAGRPRGLEAPALSLTGADPPDAAASPVRAGASCRAVDTPSEAASRPRLEAAEHGQPLGAARGPRSRSVRWAGVAAPPPAGRPSPTASAGPRRPRAPRGARSRELPGRESRLWNAPGACAITCARAATRKCRRLTWSPGGAGPGAGRRRAGRAGAGRGLPGLRPRFWSSFLCVSHTFQSPVEGAARQQICYSASGPRPGCDCLLLRIAGAYSGIPGASLVYQNFISSN